MQSQNHPSSVTLSSVVARARPQTQDVVAPVAFTLPKSTLIGVCKTPISYLLPLLFRNFCTADADCGWASISGLQKLLLGDDNNLIPVQLALLPRRLGRVPLA